MPPKGKIAAKRTAAPAKAVAAAAVPAKKGPGKFVAGSTAKLRATPQVPVADEDDEEFDDEDDEEEFEEGSDDFGSEEFEEGDFDLMSDEEDDEELDEDEFGAGENGEIDFDDMSDEGLEEEDEADSDINDDDDFERKAAKYKKQMQQEGRLSAMEQATERAQNAKSTVLKDRELAAAEAAEEEGAERPMGLLQPSASTEELRDRIKETIRVLSRFREEREDDRDRNEYLALLRADFIELFEYNEYLMDVILDMFPPHEAFEFLEAMEKQRPTTIRVNTIKSKRRDLVQNLVKRGINVEPLEKWSKVGLQVFDSKVPVAGTVEYLAGHYMLQAAASFLPVMALAPEENERVLDMAAAPGGKTTYIAQLMKNTGVLFANDVSEPRCKSLNANLQRLGVTNCLVTNYSGVDYGKVMKNFNRVLLDAPCTGCGIISRDKSIKTSKSYEDVQRASQLQRNLLLNAIDVTKTGGVIVYSTCSFLVEEDEAVVDYALRRRHVKLVDCELPFGRPGVTKYRHARYDPDLALTRKYLPHVHNMDGFYVAKLIKLKDGPIITPGEQRAPLTAEERAAAKAARDAVRAATKTVEPAPTEEALLQKTKISVPPKAKLVPRSGANKKRQRGAEAAPTKAAIEADKPAAAKARKEEPAAPAAKKAAPKAAAAKKAPASKKAATKAWK